MVTKGGKRHGGGDGGVMNWEIAIDMYTLMCVNSMTNKNLLYKKINKTKFKNSKQNTNSCENLKKKCTFQKKRKKFYFLSITVNSPSFSLFCFKEKNLLLLPQLSLNLYIYMLFLGGPLQFSHLSSRLGASEHLNSIAASPQKPLSTAHDITLEMNKYFLGANVQSLRYIRRNSEYSKESKIFGRLCNLVDGLPC